MNRFEKLACLLLASGFAGCGLQPYQLPEGAESAKLKVATGASPWICGASDPPKKLVPDESGYAAIPAGSRVTIGSSFFASGYHVNYTCFAKVSLVPASGILYYQDFETEAEHCSSLIFRESTTNPAGLDFEPTEGRAIACPAK